MFITRAYFRVAKSDGKPNTKHNLYMVRLQQIISDIQIV